MLCSCDPGLNKNTYEQTATMQSKTCNAEADTLFTFVA